jgi:hypothetical protein
MAMKRWVCCVIWRLLWVVLCGHHHSRRTIVVGAAKNEEVQVDRNGEMMMQQPKLDSVTYEHEYDKNFSSTRYKTWSRIHELFPSSSMLDKFWSAWESYPLYFPSSKKNSTRFSDLFRTPDVWTVLNQTGLIHGKDYTILKFLIRDGEEWNGQIPLSTIPLSDIPMLVQNKSFSLVIHDLQTKWLPVMELAQDLELELLPSSVSCNMYWTPSASSRAFETHMDWMDVIVLQLEGKKDWSIWHQPMIQWVLPDQKRKPTLDELVLKPTSTDAAFFNVRLSPGDLLYIPRGFLHNATTPPPSLKSINEEKEETKNLSSLHLTIGIEHGFFSTVEALVHHALNLFVTVAPQNDIVLLCGKQVSYKTLLHWAISDMTHRTNCGGFGETDDDKTGKKRKQSEKQHICALRRSVPFHPQSLQRLDGDYHEKMKQQFMESLNTVATHLSIVTAVQFARSKAQPIQAKALDAQPYTYPGMTDSDRIQTLFAGCQNLQVASDLALIKEHQESFLSFARDFARYGQEIFVETRNVMLKHIQSRRVLRWIEQRNMLEKATAHNA